MDTTNDILYADDFGYADYYPANYLAERGNEPRYTVDYSGAFLVTEGRLKQQLSEEISQWQKNEPSAVIGDHRWMNYKAEVQIELPDGGFAGIAIREQTGLGYKGSGYNLSIDSNGDWVLNKRESYIASGNAGDTDSGRHVLALTGMGNKIIAEIDGNVVCEYEDSNAELFGRVRLFSGWNEAYYDNLLVSKLTGDMDISTIPYGGALIDNADDAVSYDGNWDINIARGSANDWYRSTSKSSAAGASFSFDINTDAFALIGENSSAKLDVICDGVTIASDTDIRASKQHGAFYVQEGLGKGEHEVKVVLKSGSVTLDAIMPIGNLPTIVQKPEPKPEPTPTHGPSVTPAPTPVTSVTPEPQVTAAPIISTTPVEKNTDTLKNTKVKIKSAKRSKGKVTLIWKKLAGATGYIIERSNNSKKFKLVKTIKKNKTVKYIDKKAGKKTVYYRIRAYKGSGKGRVYSKYSKVIKVKK